MPHVLSVVYATETEEIIPMKVYAIYANAHHTPGKVSARAAAEAAKDDQPAAWSVQPKHAPDKHG